MAGHRFAHHTTHMYKSLYVHCTCTHAPTYLQVCDGLLALLLSSLCSVAQTEEVVDGLQ